MKRFPRAERARPTSRARRSPSSSVLYTVMGAVVVWSGLFAGLGRAVAAQTPPLPRTMPAPAPAARAATSPGLTQLFGTVRDSIADRTLRGAVVQIVASDDASRFARTAVSDSLGRFVFDSVPDGRYTLGFFHPMLDSLGMQPVARPVVVSRQGAMLVDLAIPGASKMRDLSCGPKTSPNAGAAVVGVVRDARTRAPLKDVRVVGQWYEVTLGTNGVQRRTPRRVTTTNDDGWYALCDVPGPGSLAVTASRGADSTDVVEMDVPRDGFLRRELFLGAARTVSVVDSAPVKDTLVFRPKAVHLGDARLTGTVIAADGGAPIGGAVIGITNGPQTRANDRGQWTLSSVPPGSRTLEVRAVGHVPVRRSVDVIDGTPPIRVAMVTFKATLDTLKITAGLSGALDRSQFEQRRKTLAMGRFLTAADIAKRMPIETTDLFRNFPGLELRRTATSDVILMKGVFEDQCVPTIFLNGTAMNGVEADVINNFVRPERIIGIEVYSPTSMPPQFQSAMSGCGAIVIWSRN